MTASSKTAPILLFAGFVLFLTVIAYALASAFVRPEVPAFEPSPVTPHLPPDTLIVDTLTVDARDTHAWQFVDFARRSVVVPPDTAGWTLALRRFDLVPSGAAVDLGIIAFDSVRSVPAAGLVLSEFSRDTTNGALHRWYAYSFVTHIMSPNGHVYGIRTRDGRFAKLEVLSYYCPGAEAGCVTFRYAYQPSGDPAVSSAPGSR